MYWVHCFQILSVHGDPQGDPMVSNACKTYRKQYGDPLFSHQNMYFYFICSYSKSSWVAGNIFEQSQSQLATCFTDLNITTQQITLLSCMSYGWSVGRSISPQITPGCLFCCIGINMHDCMREDQRGDVLGDVRGNSSGVMLSISCALTSTETLCLALLSVKKWLWAIFLASYRTHNFSCGTGFLQGTRQRYKTMVMQKWHGDGNANGAPQFWGVPCFCKFTTCSLFQLCVWIVLRLKRESFEQFWCVLLLLPQLERKKWLPSCPPDATRADKNRVDQECNDFTDVGVRVAVRLHKAIGEILLWCCLILCLIQDEGFGSNPKEYPGECWPLAHFAPRKGESSFKKLVWQKRQVTVHVAQSKRINDFLGATEGQRLSAPGYAVRFLQISPGGVVGRVVEVFTQPAWQEVAWLQIQLLTMSNYCSHTCGCSSSQSSEA